jgi:predicted O-methyltransferase YrrM
VTAAGGEPDAGAAAGAEREAVRSAAEERWAAVDEYLSDRLAPGEPALTEALAANAAAGLVAADVSPAQGRLLELLARVCGARAILEIGTLGGYSTIWLARALPPDGRLVTLEADAHHAAVARANLARAGLTHVVEVVEGPALETLPGVAGVFDLVFIDADKERSADYLALALERSRPGTLIVADNVVRGGAVVDVRSADPRVIGVRRLVEAVAAEPRLVATGLQTVGVKGWDGMVLALVV